MIVFFIIFIYYAMVFVIAYICANWYYGKQENGCCRGFGLLNRGSIGSITFLSLIFVFIQLIKYLAIGGYQN